MTEDASTFHPGTHQVPSDPVCFRSSLTFPSCPPVAAQEICPEDPLQGLKAHPLSHQSPILIQTLRPSRNLTEKTWTPAPSAFNWGHGRQGAQ